MWFNYPQKYQSSFVQIVILYVDKVQKQQQQKKNCSLHLLSWLNRQNLFQKNNRILVHWNYIFYCVSRMLNWHLTFRLYHPSVKEWRCKLLFLCRLADWHPPVLEAVTTSYFFLVRLDKFHLATCCTCFPYLLSHYGQTWSHMTVSQFRGCVLGSTHFEVAGVLALGKVLSHFTGNQAYSKCNLKMHTCFQPVSSIHHE